MTHAPTVRPAACVPAGPPAMCAGGVACGAWHQFRERARGAKRPKPAIGEYRGFRSRQKGPSIDSGDCVLPCEWGGFWQVRAAFASALDAVWASALFLTYCKIPACAGWRPVCDRSGPSCTLLHSGWPKRPQEMSAPAWGGIQDIVARCLPVCAFFCVRVYCRLARALRAAIRPKTLHSARLPVPLYMPPQTLPISPAE